MVQSKAFGALAHTYKSTLLQSVHQLFKAGSDQGLIAHAYSQAWYPVCLYLTCMQAAFHVRLQDEQMQQHMPVQLHSCGPSVLD